jgi:hypothetical protein
MRKLLITARGKANKYKEQKFFLAMIFERKSGFVTVIHKSWEQIGNKNLNIFILNNFYCLKKVFGVGLWGDVV